MLVTRPRWLDRLSRAIGEFTGGPVGTASDLCFVAACQVVNLLKRRGDAYSLAPATVHLRIHPDDLSTLRVQLDAIGRDLDEVVRRAVEKIIEDEQRPPVLFPPGFTVRTDPDPNLRPGRLSCTPGAWQELMMFPFLAGWNDASAADRPEPRVMLRDGEVVNEALLRPLAPDDGSVSRSRHATVRVIPDDSIEIRPEKYTEVDGQHLEGPKTLRYKRGRSHTVRFGETMLVLFWDEAWGVSVPGGVR